MISTTWSRAMEGWVAGCAAATGVVYVYTVATILYAANVSDGHPFSVRALAFTTLVSVFLMILPTLLIFLVTCLLTAIPAAVTVWLSERFRIRSIVFFGLAGAVIGGASAYFLSGATSTQPSPLFVSAGLAAGLAYWSVAGRHAGREQSSTPA